MPGKRLSTKPKLAAYRAKRDFTKSPEPSGDSPKKAAAARTNAPASTKPKKSPPTLFFCVQKHLASHLHYDFRLEHGGVLLSWAVPKGPSLRPADKRLAMKVEDHPLDYGNFEGVIPEGYGAGIVMLWDQGSWRPLVDDVDAALEKGDLKFELDGVKLKGSWALVRTHGRGGNDDRSWLLIKHRDDWAGEIDVIESAPLSVKTFGDFADILAADHPPIWESHRPGGQGGGVTSELMQEVIDEAAALRARKPAKAKRAAMKK